jgi:hypothetical protein
MKTTMTCQECGKAPAAYTVTATGQLFSAMMAEGKMGQVVWFVRSQRVQGVPQNAKTPIPA